MARLSRTILAGTQQMKDAAFGLRDVKAAKTRRKKVAIEAAGQAFADAGATFKQHGDWKRAKADEDGMRQVDDAYALGLTTNGGRGALTALGALSVRTPGAARLRADLTTKASELVRKSEGDDLRDAQAEQLRALAEKTRTDTEESTRIRDERSTLLNEYPLPTDATEQERWNRAMFVSGQITGKEYMRNAVSNAKLRETEKKRVSVETMAEKKNKATAELEERKIEGRKELQGQRDTAAGVRQQSLLDARASAAENATNLRKWLAGQRMAVERAKLELGIDRAKRERAVAHLRQLRDNLELSHKLSMMKQWADEGQSDLIDTLQGELSATDRLLDDLKSMESEPSFNLPYDADQGGAAPAGGAAPPPDLTPEELDSYNSLDADGKAEFIKALGG